jgi:DNA-binding transcriptional LysR family regulator
MSATAEGELVLTHARTILAQMSDLERALGVVSATPSGLLRVNAALGFGRSHIGPLLSKFSQAHPQVEVRLHLTADPPPLSEDAFDVCVRFGAPPDARVIARKLADNERVLCASPRYLKLHGAPETPKDLAQHNFISIRQGDDAYGVLRLARRGTSAKTTEWETVKTRGNLTTNDGGVALQWALDGHGVLLRAQWDVERHLEAGRLIRLLPKYRTPEANLHVFYPPQHHGTARVRAFVEFLEDSMR